MSMSMSCLTETPWQEEPIQGKRPIEEILLPSFDPTEGVAPLCSALLSSAELCITHLHCTHIRAVSPFSPLLLSTHTS